MIDLDVIKGRIANGIYGDDRLTAAEILDALAAMDELVAEVEHLRGERAAVVAWLRGEPERLVECNGRRHADGKTCFVMSPMPAEELADAIERGEHLKEKP